MAKVKIENEILERIASINKQYIVDCEDAPTDPQEFLDWWWSQASNCKECYLCESRNSVVKPDGLANADIMIVGEGPGFLEDLARIPIVGPQELKSSHCNMCTKIKSCFSARILDNPNSYGKKAKKVTCLPNYEDKEQITDTLFLRSTGSILDGILLKWKFKFARHNWIEYYNKHHVGNEWEHKSPFMITNIALCRTTDATGLRDQSPSSVTKNKCKRWLAFQWAAVNPKIIICFGREALAILAGNDKKAGLVVPNEIINTKFGPVIYQQHPAAFMREDKKAVRALGYAKVYDTVKKALEYCEYDV